MTGPKLFYTVEELREYCKLALQEYLKIGWTGEFTKYFKGTDIIIRSWSNNSVNIHYYGRRLEFKYIKKGKVLL